MKNGKKDRIHRLSAPSRLFCYLLVVIFSGELLVMFLLPFLFPVEESIVVVNFTDSLLLTIIIAPFIWMLIIRPLRNAAVAEETRTKAVLEHVVDGIVMLNDKGVIEAFNGAAEKMFDYTALEAAGMEMMSLLPGEDILSGGMRNSSHEIAGRRKDGLLFPVDFSVSKVLVGNRLMFICIIRDISQRKEAEESIRRLNTELVLHIGKLREAQEELVHKEKLATIGQVANNMGRELRNILGGVSNAVYYLKSVQPDANEVVKEYLDIIKQESNNSLRLISTLLDFSWPRPPYRSPIMVGELVGETLGNCSVPENVTVRVDMPDALPPVGVDSQQIGQVLENLVTNAVQAMPGGGALRISARRLSAECGVRNAELKTQAKDSALDEDFVEISVKDTGEGISPENMKKLFQPLFTTRVRGIGLGLSVCKNLVEANGGRIEVASKPGKGTTFTVVLPVEADVTGAELERVDQETAQ